MLGNEQYFKEVILCTMKDVYFSYILKILFHQIKRYLDNTTSNNEFTGAQSRILHYLMMNSENDDIFQRDIEEEFDIRRSTATGILQLMEKNGMIIRLSVPYDGRLKKIVLTKKAINLKETISNHIENLETILIKDIPKENLEICFNVLKQMLKNLE